jgi:hypothetical protein
MLTSRISELSSGEDATTSVRRPISLLLGLLAADPTSSAHPPQQPQRQALAVGRHVPALDRRPDARSRPPVPPHHRLRQARRSDRAPARSDQSPAPTERPLRSPPHSPHTWTAVAKNPRRPGHLHRDAESLSCSRRPAGARPQLPFPAPIRDCRSTASTEEQGCARSRCGRPANRQKRNSPAATRAEPLLLEPQSPVTTCHRPSRNRRSASGGR